MPPLIALDTWNVRGISEERKPHSRCFLVAEGANTEYWYLSQLATILSKKNLPERIELKPVERTAGDRNNSHPRALAKQAKEIREDAKGDYGFEEEVDRIIIFFDADVYRGDAETYAKDLEDFRAVADIAVTNPSFELFLILHKRNAFRDIIEPNRDGILRNGHVENGHRRYISSLVTEELGLNTKKNSKAVAALANDFDIALQEEENLNQDPDRAIGTLTSNIAKTFEQLIEAGREEPQSQTRA